MHDFVCVIPARLKSTRLPEKPLLDIVGKSMIERTYQRATMVLKKDKVYIATDSKKIFETCMTFTDNVVLTSESCLTGTDRIAEFASAVNAKCYINLQGDEPLMPVGNIKEIVRVCINDPDSIHNGYAPILNENDFYNYSIPKIVLNGNQELMYMSRSPIPGNKEQRLLQANKQICLYSFTKQSLLQFGPDKNKTPVENIEDIEILRFLEKGFTIKMWPMSPNTIAVDTYDDLNRVIAKIRDQGEGLEEYTI